MAKKLWAPVMLPKGTDVGNASLEINPVGEGIDEELLEAWIILKHKRRQGHISKY